MNKLEPPGKLSLEGNVAVNWKKWKQMFNIYLCATKMNNESDEIKSSIFLHVIGEEAVDIYNSFEFEHEADRVKLNIIVERFDAFCNPKKNLTVERHNFFTRNQIAGESFDQWITDLKLKSQSCEFETLKDSLIKDRIVSGISDKQIKARLLRENDLTLDRAIAICHLAEQATLQIRALDNKELMEATVAAVRRPVPQKGQARNEQRVVERDQTWTKQRLCGRCGRQHTPQRCPATGKICYKCNGRNHFGSVCRSVSNSNARIYDIEQYDDSENDNQTLILGSIIKNDFDSSTVWEEKLIYNDKVFYVKIDTGAQANVMSLAQYEMLNGKSKLNKCGVKLTTYTGEHIPVSGEINMMCTFKGRQVLLRFIIVPVQVPTVLSLQVSRKLGLINMAIESINVKVGTVGDVMRYREAFEGLGCLQGKYHIALKEENQPVVHAPRRVPVMLRERVEEELHRMENLKVITKVTEPTDWVNSMVIVEKKNKNLRICLDPRDLNRAIKRSHYKLPTVDEIASKLIGAQYFSVLDASS